MLPNATDRCDFRDERSCFCRPGECHAQGHFIKPRPATCDTTGWQYGIVFLFAAACIFWGSTFGHPEQQRLDRIAQESGR